MEVHVGMVLFRCDKIWVKHAWHKKREGVSQTFKEITFASLFLKRLLEKLLAAAEALPSLVTPFRLGVKMENFSAVQWRCCILTFPETG